MKTLPSHFWFSKINFSCTSLMEPICWTPDLSINNCWILILKNQWSCFWFRLDLYLVKKTFKLYIRNKWWSLKKAVKTSLKSLSLFTVFLLFLSCMNKFVFFFYNQLSGLHASLVYEKSCCCTICWTSNCKDWRCAKNVFKSKYPKKHIFNIIFIASITRIWTIYNIKKMQLAKMYLKQLHQFLAVNHFSDANHNNECYGGPTKKK